MKLDSVILTLNPWSPRETNKLRFRLNTAYQSCQNEMFTPCRYLSQHRQLTSLLHPGCEAILILSHALLFFFHCIISCAALVAKFVNITNFQTLLLLCLSLSLFPHPPLSLCVSFCAPFFSLSIGSHGHTHVEQCPCQTWPQAFCRWANGLPGHQPCQVS